MSLYLCFSLSMPRNNSWNGKWTGEGKPYLLIRSFTKKQEFKAREILEKGYFTYSFGDGWAAGISVEKVNGRETAKLRRSSAGFCGYEWMVDHIIEKGWIGGYDVTLFTNRNVAVFFGRRQSDVISGYVDCYGIYEPEKLLAWMSHEERNRYFICKFREWEHEISAKEFKYLLGLQTKEMDQVEIQAAKEGVL